MATRLAGPDIRSLEASTNTANFKIFKHSTAHLFPRDIMFTAIGIHLYGIKKNFSTGVVVALAFRVEQTVLQPRAGSSLTRLLF